LESRWGLPGRCTYNASDWKSELDHLQKMICYRNRAEELRAMLDDFRDDDSRRVLSRLADDYDRMAENVQASMRPAPLVF